MTTFLIILALVVVLAIIAAIWHHKHLAGRQDKLEEFLVTELEAVEQRAADAARKLVDRARGFASNSTPKGGR